MRKNEFSDELFPSIGIVPVDNHSEWSIWGRSPAVWARVTESRLSYLRRHPDSVAQWGSDVLMPAAVAFMNAIARQHARVVSAREGAEQTVIKFWLYDLSKVEPRDLVRDLDIDGFPTIDGEPENTATRALAREVKRIVAKEILRAVQEGRRLYYQHHARTVVKPSRSLLTHDDQYRGLMAQLMVNFWQESELAFPQQARVTERRAQLQELHLRRKEITHRLLTEIGASPDYVVDRSMMAGYQVPPMARGGARECTHGPPSYVVNTGAGMQNRLQEVARTLAVQAPSGCPRHPHPGAPDMHDAALSRLAGEYTRHDSERGHEIMTGFHRLVDEYDRNITSSMYKLSRHLRR